MGEELFRLVSTGLLAVIALLLIVTVARLGRLHKKLEAGTPAPVEEPSPEPEAAPEVTPADEPAATATEAIPTSEPEPGPAEGPFEKDGRWWYRQDDDLLVYDDRTEQWVAAETHPLEAARGWDAGPIDAGPAPAEAAPVAAQPEAAPEPAYASEPVGATPEALGGTQEPAVETVEPVTAAPISEPVDPPPPITDATEEAPAAATHWKCPACGVINGSTATSCRMCFAARP